MWSERIRVSRRGPMSSAYFPNGAVLAIGGRPTKGPALARDLGFDVLVLTADTFQPPANAFVGLRVVHVSLADGPQAPPPTRTQVVRAWRVADYVASALRSRKRVIITCEMGLNRSALVAALTFRRLGMSPTEAVALVRRMRGRFALNNKNFQQIVAS